jgi:5-methylcytosine-specific restriction endonuclease McrA
MKSYSLSHLADSTLRVQLSAAAASERTSTAALLAHIAEFDAPRLYAPSGSSTMKEYCVTELHLSEDAASKRVYAARTARRFPIIFEALADGRLHLSAIITLGSHLGEGTTAAAAQDLLAAAFHKTRSEIELMLAHRFPQPPVPALVQPIPASAMPMLSPAAPAPLTMSSPQHAPGHVTAAGPRPEVKPLAPQSCKMQLTMDQDMFDDLQRLYELLGLGNRAEDVREVVRRSFKALIQKTEKRKYASTDRPRAPRQHESSSPRHIPAEVRRAVVRRDGGQCTFRSESGRRCAARKFLEFDHIEPVARGGTSTVANLRLRCSAHNQYEAERTYGAEFMNAKREQAAAAKEQTELLVSCLRRLGYNAADSKRAAEFASGDGGLTLEERVKKALTWFRPRILSVSQAAPG